MIIALQILFWGSALMLAHTYVFYPLILRLLFSLGNRKLKHRTETGNAGVTILMSVYNEEKIIAKKLESVFNSNFPPEKLEILIGSDCSNDRTEQIIEDFSKKYPQVKLFAFKERKGKPQILNELIKHATNELVIFTDANVLFAKENISNLLKMFSDEVGLAGSTIINEGIKKEGISRQEKSYIRGENKIKYLEGALWGTMMGPFGGCFMMRKKLFEEIPPNFIVDDFFLSMVVLEKKYKAVCSADAICFEDVPDEMQMEFRRKKRISAGNYQNLKRFFAFAMKPFNAAGFCFLSHKVFRWWGPFAIIITTLTSLLLSFHSEFYFLVFAFTALLLVMPLFDHIQKKLGINNFMIRLCSYFVVMNMALLAGYIQYKKGIKSNVWSRTERVIAN